MFDFSIQNMFLNTIRSILHQTSWSTRTLIPTRALTAANYDEAKETEMLERPTISEDSPLRRIDVANLEITRTTTPRDCPPVDSLVWGEVFSDHMLEVCFFIILIFIFYLFISI